jgi:hypothetical protein
MDTVISHGFLIKADNNAHKEEIIEEIIPQVNEDTGYVEGLVTFYNSDYNDVNYDIFICPYNALNVGYNDSSCFPVSNDFNISDEVKTQMNDFADYLHTVHSLDITKYLDKEVYVYTYTFD